MSAKSSAQSLEALQKALGYTFTDPALLALALKHASLPRKAGSVPAAQQNNERLEFVGDRVLGLVMAADLYTRHPADREGDLAKRHTVLVQQSALVTVARHLKLVDYIERAAGSGGDVIEADAVEALMGAVFIDGGYTAVAAVIDRLWQPLLEGGAKQPPTDPKSTLQEWAQGRGLSLPVYAVVGKSGSDHAPSFTVELSVQKQKPVRATAASKRLAEKQAALLMLEQIGEGKKNV